MARAETFDVIVVGSGAGGGMACYALTRLGARVCLLEAGRDYDPSTETPMFGRNYQAPLRNAPTPDKPFGFFDATVGGGWQIEGEPYAAAAGSQFRWFRPRMLGGRTNHWGRVALRYAAHDFKAASQDGLGVDWPLSYDEMAPWYDRVERLIGVIGNQDGLDDAPDSPDGVLQPPPTPRAYEHLIIAAGQRLNRPVVANHAAVLTRPLGGRPSCLYATPCVRGCSIGANFQSTTVLLPAARATGRLTIRTGAMVREVAIGKDGAATGVHYVDRVSGRAGFVAARSVMLAAGAMESVRILLNSRNPRFPDGIGAAGGMLGRAIMDSTGSNLWGQFPQLESLPPFNDDGISYPHVYIPWWGLAQQRAGRLDFARGYHIELDGGRQEPGANSFALLDQIAPLRFGAALKADARRYYGSFVRFAQRGETLANPDNRVELDHETPDRWGIPTLRFHYRWSDQELRQTRHAQTSMAEFVEAAGGRVINGPHTDPAKAILAPGAVIHEVGGARMGAVPSGSVTDRFGRVWGAGNLYVCDGAVFPSNAHKNPTLTILALAWRAAERLMTAGQAHG